MPEPEGITAEELRARADQLREVLRILDDGQLQASARERAYIAGALHAVELMQADLYRDASTGTSRLDGPRR